MWRIPVQLASSTAAELRAAGVRMRGVQAVLRLCVAGDFDAAAAPEGLKRLLAASLGATDFAALELDLKGAQARVRGYFEATIGVAPE